MHLNKNELLTHYTPLDKYHIIRNGMTWGESERKRLNVILKNEMEKKKPHNTITVHQNPLPKRESFINEMC